MVERSHFGGEYYDDYEDYEDEDELDHPEDDPDRGR